MKTNRLKKIALCGLFSTMALLSFVIESLFPPLIIPGAKLGLSNVFVLIATISLGASYGYFTLLVKVILGSLFAGNISAIIYSLPSQLIALTLEIILICWVNKVSIVSISVLGATINIITQNIIFCLYTFTIEYLIYLPYLSLIGVIGGAVVGFTVYLVVKKFPKNLYINEKC